MEALWTKPSPASICKNAHEDGLFRLQMRRSRERSALQRICAYAQVREANALSEHLQDFLEANMFDIKSKREAY
jgi:hypothetical protein